MGYVVYKAQNAGIARNWSNPENWESGILPAPNSNLTIASDQKYILDGPIDFLHTLIIDGELTIKTELP